MGTESHELMNTFSETLLESVSVSIRGVLDNHRSRFRHVGDILVIDAVWIEHGGINSVGCNLVGGFLPLPCI